MVIKCMVLYLATIASTCACCFICRAYMPPLSRTISAPRHTILGFSKGLFVLHFAPDMLLVLALP